MIVCDKTRLTEKQLVEFLLAIDKDFPIYLSDKVDIVEYAKKLMDRADFVAEIEENSIRGLVVGYINNIIGDSAYIALVGVRREYRGQGIAKQLLNVFVEWCSKTNIQSVNLYTHQTNALAIKMYAELGFEVDEEQAEVRPQDIHYSYYLKR